MFDLWLPRRTDSHISTFPLRLDENLHVSVEFNQLKFVNKQLYAEAADLELKFNHILVGVRIKPGHVRPGHLFLHWLSNLTPAKTAWLRTITLKHIEPVRRIPSNFSTFPLEFPEPPETFAELAVACRANPNMTVRYEMLGWIFGPPFPMYALVFAYAFRGYDELRMLLHMLGIHPQSELCGIVQRAAEKWQNGVDYQALNARNLRILPSACDGAEMSEALDSISRKDTRQFFERWAEEGV